MTALIAMLAVIIDRTLGEPRRGHPLVGFGRLALAVERRFLNTAQSLGQQKRNGVIAVLLLAAGTAAPLWLLIGFQPQHPVAFIAPVVILYLTLGGRSLDEHAIAVESALEAEQPRDARLLAGRMVSRDTTELSPDEISKAAIESVLENGCDAVIAPLFWFVIAGAPGALCYRVVNTLDAMWGYRRQPYLHFEGRGARGRSAQLAASSINRIALRV